MASVSRIFLGELPDITDGPGDLVEIVQGDGAFPTVIMEFDKFSAHIFAGMRYIRERHQRQSDNMAPVIPLCSGCEKRRHG